MAGPGRRLDGTDTPPPTTSKSTKAQRDAYVAPQRKELTSEARYSCTFKIILPSLADPKCIVELSRFRTAAEAALARVQSQKTDTTHFNTSLAAIRAQVQRELEAERKTKTDLEQQSSQEKSQPKILEDDHNLNLAAQGVYFRFENEFYYLNNTFIISFGVS